MNITNTCRNAEGKKRSEGYKHKCDLCGKSYRFQRWLTDHVNSFHLGLKLYKCDLCDKVLGASEELRHHVSFFHGVKQQCFTFVVFSSFMNYFDVVNEIPFTT